MYRNGGLILCAVCIAVQSIEQSHGLTLLCWLQIMSVGGNGRARQFFKQHGWTELGSDKIEQKVLLF